jgi:hypothetical protein
LSDSPRGHKITSYGPFRTSTQPVEKRPGEAVVQVARPNLGPQYARGPVLAAHLVQGGIALIPHRV